MKHYRIMIVIIFILQNCTRLETNILDPSKPIGFLIQRDLCVAINICPPDFFRVREMNSLTILSPPSIGVFSGNQINFVTPFRADWTKLKARFSFRGSYVSVQGKNQDSGTSENDFTKPQIYSVFAFDKKNSDYIVKANRASFDAKAINAYRFLLPEVSAFILGNQISIFVPFDTNVQSLVSEIFTTGDSVNINGITQQSGITANDFTIPKTYTVVAADGSTQEYIVSVFKNTLSSNDLKAFQIPSLGLNGTISGTNVDLIVPANTPLSGLTPNFSHDGVKIKVGATDQTSGQSIQNFNNPVIYTIVAQNGNEKNYTVRVSTATNSSKDITSFYLNTPPSVGVINNTNSTIALTVPANTNLRNLVPSFTITGSGINVNGTPQVSAITGINFSTPVIYSVLAIDGSIKNYTVTVGF